MSIKKTTSTIESTTSGEHRLQKNSIPKIFNPIVSKENKLKSSDDFLTDNKSTVFFSLAWFYFQPSFTWQSTLAIKMFGPGGLTIKYNAYVSEGSNE